MKTAKVQTGSDSGFSGGRGLQKGLPGEFGAPSFWPQLPVLAQKSGIVIYVN